MGIYLYVVLLFFINLYFVCYAIAENHENCQYFNGYLDCLYRNISPFQECRFPENVTTMNFSFNEIDNIRSTCLQNITMFPLTNNGIKYIDSNTLIGLKYTLTLMINDEIWNVPPDVFKPLASLRRTAFGQNSCSRRLSSYQRNLRGLSYPKQLKVLSDAVSCKLYLADSCTISKELSTLDSWKCYNAIDVIMEIFQRIKNLTELKFAIKENGIPSGLFQHFLYLESIFIDINTDNIDIDSVFKSFDDFARRNMTLISVTGNNYLNSFIINRHHFRHIENICLKQLILKHMYISHIEYRSFQVFAFKSKCLEVLDISENPLTTNSNRWLLYLHFFPRLKIFRASYFKRSAVIDNRIYHVYGSTTTHFGIVTFSVPVKLEEFHIRHTFSRYDLPTRVHFLNGNNMKVLDFAYVGITACNETLNGLPNLLFFDMSGWNCSIINENVLSSFPKLQTFIARESFLGIGLTLNHNSFKLFKKNLDLRHIDLSKNGISKLPGGLIGSHLNQLQFFNLSNNKLIEFPEFSTAMSNLKVVDLRFNYFANIPTSMWKVLEEINPSNLYLGGNPFQCSCENIKFLMWLSKTKLLRAIDIQNMKCTTETGTFLTMSSVLGDINHFSERCVSKALILIITTSCSIVVVAVILIIVYTRYKYFFEYIYIRLKMKLKTYRRLEECGYEFDAFVSHSHLDKEWVLDLNNILRKRGVNFCLDDKDFDIGESIAENVVKAIDNSRKVIFVITENFLNSSWGSYELEMTRMHAFREDRDNMIIIILKDDIPLHKMPKILRQIWYKIVCIKWHDQPTNEIETEELFYSRLREAIFH